METTASAKSSECLANLPRANAADYYIDGTQSNKRGLSKDMTPINNKRKMKPADYNASIF